MAAVYCSASDVIAWVKLLDTTRNWQSTDIDTRIEQAQDRMRAIFVPLYGTTEVVSWDTTTPPLITDLCAQLAAVLCLMHATGESALQEGRPGGVFYEEWKARVEALRTREEALLRADGTIIPFCDTAFDDDSLIGSTMYDREPVYTMGEEVLDELEPGSLDEF